MIDPKDRESEAASAPNELVTASVLMMASSSTGLVVGLIRSKLVALLLGPAGVGVLSNLSIYNNLVVTTATAVAGQGSTRAIAAERAMGRDDRLDWLIRYTFLVPTAIGLLLLIGSAALASQVAATVMGDSGYATLVVISAVGIPLGALATAYAGVLQGYVRIGSLARAGIVSTLGSLVLTVGLVLWFGITGAALAIPAVLLLQLAIYFRQEPWVVLDRRWRRRLAVNWPALGPVLQLGIASVVLALAGLLVSLLIRTDIVQVLGVDQNGVYQPVAALSDTYFEILISSTSVYLFPRLTQLLSTGDKHQAAREVGHGLRVVLGVTMPFMLLGIGLSVPVVVLFYSDSFQGAGDPLAIQMAGNVLKTITWSIGAATLPLGFYRAWLLIGLVNLLVKLVAVHLLLPTMGLNGVAVAYDLSWAFSCVTETALVVAIGRLNPGWRDWLRALTAVAFIAVTLGGHMLTPVLGLILALVAACVWIAVSRVELGDLVKSVEALVVPQARALAWRIGRRGSP